MFSGAGDAVAPLYDAGTPSDPSMPAYYQVGNRWTSTASGSTGSTGSGITLTWSIVPDGTRLGSGADEPNAGSDLRARLNALYGGQSTWLPLIQSVFTKWGAISGITYKYEASDDGADFSSTTEGRGVLGARGDIRIGGQAIDGPSGTLAYNWFPNFGDMVLDTDDLRIGGFMEDTADNSLRLRNVVAHEHGHGLGFDHVDPTDETKLMEALAATAFDGPQFDDKLAVQRSYGDAFEKSGGNNSTGSATSRGTLSDGGNTIVSDVSLSTTSDVDLYKITTTATRDASFTLAPTGPTYPHGPVGGAVTNFNAKSQMDLRLQVLAGDGSTVIGAAESTGVGANEILTLSDLAAGTYYLKVLPESGASNASAQMYSLSANLTDDGGSGGGTATTRAALDSASNLVISDIASGGKADTLSVKADHANNRYVIADANHLIATTIAGATGNGTHTVHVPFSVVTGNRVTINTAGGSDSVQIDGTKLAVTVDGGAERDTIGVLSTGASAAVTVTPSAGSDNLAVNASGAAGSATVNLAAAQKLGALTIGANGAVTFATGAGVLTAQSVTFTSGSGRLDLRDNDLVVDYGSVSPVGIWTGSAYDGISGHVKAGRIVTSSGGDSFALAVAEAREALNLSGSQTTTWNGQVVDSTAVLVRYTYAGDANVDGRINIDDYGRVDASFSGSGGVFGWYNGDFNFDGKINIDDYGLIDTSAGRQFELL